MVDRVCLLGGGAKDAAKRRVQVESEVEAGLRGPTLLPMLGEGEEGRGRYSH